ncbi:hypothetical protein UFOVP787_143 [uncultured Caudovirales phage]|uniref:Uncharacterized protein n=1 Tax=uncultured Caudovirales phage TaxID=2100421 RepID=A0A6J5P5P6_9CAUD|nr:hypothetical protein UFOVP787_143 [uncultured Caudovirales phage]
MEAFVYCWTDKAALIASRIGSKHSEEWKQIVKLGWEKRRANKLKKTGDSN